MGVVAGFVVALLLGTTAPASAVDPWVVIGGGHGPVPTSQPGPSLLDLGVIAEEAAVERRLRDCANRVRAEHGLPPLRLDRALGRAARSHVRAMSLLGFFSHVDHRGEHALERVERHDRRRYWSMVGENLAYGTDTPEAVCDAWMTSPSHRAVLLQRRFSRIGAGFVRAGGTGWYAEVLGELDRR